MSEEDLATLVEEIRAEYPGCFACGSDNPVGLHLDPAEMEGEVAVARYRPSPHHGGAGDTLHGGIAATLLDEIMVWAGILSHRVLTVTGTMELRYRHPVSVDDVIQVRGWVEERSGRRLRCASELRTPDDVAVTASGLYLVARGYDDA
ncbi:MAG TPA: PaaI family thioesterase [Acidimicrobiia bacterium]|nr:PaaI family thioesterase [Acidimicrobiia bacterium]